MKPTYNFWIETYDGISDVFESGLTKRQAVIKYNLLQKNWNPTIKASGWEEEKTIDSLSTTIRKKRMIA